MAFPSFIGFEFRFGFQVLEVARERDLQSQKYPNFSGAEHEDLGEMPLAFVVETRFPGTKEGLKDFSNVSDLFESDPPGELFLPGRGTFWCFFKKFKDTSQSGNKGFKTVEMEFVETLRPDLTIVRTPDELEDMGEAGKQVKNIQAQLLGVPPKQLDKPETLPADPVLPPLKTTKLPTAKQFYDETLEFTKSAAQKVAGWQQDIRDIQDTVTRPYNELTRLAAEIEQTANTALSLYRSVIQYADLPYTLARRLKTTANLLTSIARRFLPPSVDASGQVIGSQFRGSVVTHSVVSGDTLQTISATYYGSAFLAECIAEANGIFDGNAISIGDILVLPDFGGKRPIKIEILPGKSRIGQSSCEV